MVEDLNFLRDVMGGADEVIIERVHRRKKIGGGVRLRIEPIDSPLNDNNDKKELELKIEKQKELIQELETKLEKLEDKESLIKKEVKKQTDALYSEVEQKYKEYIAELESYIDELEGYIDSLKKNRSGKRIELSSKKISSILDGYLKEYSYNKIALYAGCSKGQVSRVITGKLKHTESRVKVLKEVNKLLKIHQNTKIINMLNKIKEKYA